jgi:hypothetical protein
MTSNLQQRRLSPDEFSAPDRRRLDLLASVMNQPQSPALVGEGGERLELPASIYQVLRQIVNGMREGRPMLVIPENEVLTTQAAANFLGCPARISWRSWKTRKSRSTPSAVIAGCISAMWMPTAPSGTASAARDSTI